MAFADLDFRDRQQLVDGLTMFAKHHIPGVQTVKVDTVTNELILNGHHRYRFFLGHQQPDGQFVQMDQVIV